MAGSDNLRSDTMQWYTTFYYEEELRSMLFNGLFNSGFKPGIYNAKIGLYTIDRDITNDSGQGETIYSGIHLYIGKGTTFIFSNRYTHDGRYHQDLSLPGSYIIKSTAANDLDIPIVRLGQFKTIGCDQILGNASPFVAPTDKFYIMATLIYKEDENLDVPNPEIRLAIDNSLFTRSIDTEDDSKNYYYSLLDPNSFSYWPPDGSYNYTRQGSGTSSTPGGTTITNYSDIIKNLCYLTIGEVVSVNDSNLDPNDRTCYLSGNYWNDTGLRANAADEWTKNHVFIGRGFPAYRQSYIANKNNSSPELIPDYHLNKLYVDINKIYDGDVLYDTSMGNLGYEGPLGIGEKKFEIEENNPTPDRLHTWRIDYACDNPVDLAAAVSDTADPDDYESTDYSDVVDIISDLNNNYIKGDPAHPFLSSKYLLISDIIFLTTRRKYSNLKDDSIREIFLKSNVNNSRLKVVPFRWYSLLGNPKDDPISGLFNPSSTNDEIQSGDEDYITSFDLEGFNLGSTLSGTRILPLDVSETNISRLYKIIENKNIIPNIIDYLRQHPEKSPYINPIEATSLVPAAIVFRKVQVTTGQLEDGTTGITELTPVDTISTLPYQEVSGVSKWNPGRYHPANVLSFFDLEYKTNRLNPINFKSQDIYSVLPVIN